jgi:hypothetical protein
MIKNNNKKNLRLEAFLPHKYEAQSSNLSANNNNKNNLKRQRPLEAS